MSKDDPSLKNKKKTQTVSMKCNQITVSRKVLDVSTIFTKARYYAALDYTIDSQSFLISWN